VLPLRAPLMIGRAGFDGPQNLTVLLNIFRQQPREL